MELAALSKGPNISYVNRLRFIEVMMPSMQPAQLSNHTSDLFANSPDFFLFFVRCRITYLQLWALVDCMYCTPHTVVDIIMIHTMITHQIIWRVSCKITESNA